MADDAKALKTKAKVLKQVEFYFSDSNFPRDKFLSEQAAQDNGWVKIAVIASFKRMKQLTTDNDLIVAALRESKELLKVDDEGEKVRRTKSLDGVVYKENNWIYAKGFPLDSTLDSVEEFWAPKGDVLCVRLRREKGSQQFKGSIFAEFKTEEDVKKIVEGKHRLDGADEDLLVMKKTDYVTMKKEKYEAVKGKKRKATGAPDGKEKKKGKEQKAPPAEDPLNVLVAMDGLDATATRDIIKKALEATGASVRYVEFQAGRSDCTLSLHAGQDAKAVVAKLTEEKTKVGEASPTFRALEGEEEKAYWAKVRESQEAIRQKKGGRGGKRRRQ